MIQIEDGDYILGFWFAYDNKGNDWMAFVSKPKDSKIFKGCYRFRERVDEILDHTTKDKKRWVGFGSKDPNQTDDSMIDTMIKIQLAVQPKYPKLDVMLVQGGLELMMEKSKTKDWMNLQQMPLEEAQAKGII
jgi:hypothetical protein